MRKLSKECAELLETLEDVVNQACNTRGWADPPKHQVDSCALSAYAYALRLLARYGRFVIEREYNRRVIGHWRAEGEGEKDD